MLSLHPASLTAQHVGSSIDNGITIGFLVGDVKSAIDELKEKGVRIHRDIVERDAGKNAVILDPDDYLISLFEPNFEDKAQQTGGIPRIYTFLDYLFNRKNNLNLLFFILFKITADLVFKQLSSWSFETMFDVTI